MYNGAARILNERNFYPSGLSYLNKNNPAVNHFGYGGKEEYVSPLNWLDFHARMYDPTIARWHAVDPMAEKYMSYTPYSYCMGNPVNLTDPNGMDPMSRSEAWSRATQYCRDHPGADFSSVYDSYCNGSFGSSFDGGYFGLPGTGDNGGGLHGVYYDWISGTCRDVSTKQVVNSPIILPEDIERSYYGQEAIDLLASLNNMMTGEYAVTLTDVSIGKAPSLLSNLSPMPDELAPQEDVSFPQSTGDGLKPILSPINDGFTAIGTVAGAGELFIYANAGARITYTTINNGTRAWVSTSKVTGAFHTAGNLTLGAGIAIDFTLSIAGEQSWGKTALNTTISGMTILIGGIPGIVIGFGYVVLDKTGMFEGPTGSMGYTPPSITMPDATRVAPPIFYR